MSWPVTADDRSLVACWTAHGMPANDSTRDYATRLLARLIAQLDALTAEIDAVIDARELSGQLDLFGAAS